MQFNFSFKDTFLTIRVKKSLLSTYSIDERTTINETTVKMNPSKFDEYGKRK